MAGNGHGSGGPERPEGPRGHADAVSPEGEALAALLRDLGELRDYLAGRGQHTYELAQRFLHHAQRDSAERAYDERQATMLEYQHYVWHEIAGRVDQLVARYTSSVPDAEQAAQPEDEAARGSRAEEQ